MENHEIDEDEKQKQLKFQMNCCSKIQELQSNLFRISEHDHYISKPWPQNFAIFKEAAARDVSSASIIPIQSYFLCKHIFSAKL